eukprot:TRINITY_DN4928_c0_g1_i1.p1 TRINITY_DN4928_c0_g1~~TRINITY_DN4928_c0_g1_i1.p1  ORF type:complete len:176 (-),score=45.35 TRINITY_DN4928_c0_g1_i1:18-545(-)
MAERTPIPISCFSVVVVRLNDKFLLVQETEKHDFLFYFPAGRVELGETFEEAAIREVSEEAGIAVKIDGIIRVEHSPSRLGSRMRVIFIASPVDPAAPLKSIPDEESMGARWCSLEEIKALPLRTSEVFSLFQYVEAGAPIYPMSMITFEGRPFKLPGEDDGEGQKRKPSPFRFF